MTLALRWLLRLGGAGWLIVAIPACSGEVTEEPVLTDRGDAGAHTGPRRLEETARVHNREAALESDRALAEQATLPRKPASGKRTILETAQRGTSRRRCAGLALALSRKRRTAKVFWRRQTTPGAAWHRTPRQRCTGLGSPPNRETLADRPSWRSSTRTGAAA